MRALLIAVASLALASCQTASIDTAIQNNLPKLCSSAAIAHAAFVAAAPLSNVSTRTLRREQAAWTALQPLCADPSSQTAASVLVAAATAYATIAAALNEAE